MEKDNRMPYRKESFTRAITSYNKYKDLGLTYDYMKKEYIVKNRSLQSLANELNVKIGFIRTVVSFYGLKKSQEKIAQTRIKNMKIVGSTPRKMTPEYKKLLQKAQLKGAESRNKNIDKRLAAEGITYDSLYDLYIVKNKSLKELCQIFNRKKSNIRNLLVRFNIPAKSQELRDEIRMNNFTELYDDEERVQEIVNKTHSTIRERYSKDWYYSNSSKEETQVFDFVKSIVKKDVEVINGDYSTIFKPNTNIALQLDIYIPQFKVAIEYNGEYYHDRKLYENDLKNNTYNSRERLKTQLCKEKGIELLHIWSSDWKNENNTTKVTIDEFLRMNT